VTKEEVTRGIKECAEELGRVPTIAELMKHKRIDRVEIRKHFGNYTLALEECGLELPERGRKVEMDRLFLDWAGVVRKLKRLPKLYEYERLGRYSARPFKRLFGSWAMAPEGMKWYATEHDLAAEWGDVLELVRGQVDGQAGEQNGRRSGSQAGECGVTEWPTEIADRPVYGPLIRTPAFVYGPTNENGVLCLFGAMAEKLGFRILRIQIGYPDCEAMRVVGDDRLQPVRIEFEYESRNFLKHMHDARGCDLIVCWRHNWEECPVEVVELKEAASTQQSAVSQEQKLQPQRTRRNT